MSRTTRNIEYAIINARRISYHNRRKNECKAYEEIATELGNRFIDNRLRSWRSIPTNWEDFRVSAYGEVYHENKGIYND